MRCTHCGAEFHPQARFCSRCGSPRPLEAERFRWAAAEMARLVAQRRASELDEAAFDRSRNALMIRG